MVTQGVRQRIACQLEFLLQPDVQRRGSYFQCEATRHHVPLADILVAVVAQLLGVYLDGDTLRLARLEFSYGTYAPSSP